MTPKLEEHHSLIMAKTQVRAGVLSDAAGNTNANTSNRLSLKLTSKRRTVRVFTNATDTTSSYIWVWIRTEVPVWPNLSETDVHVQHAQMSNFRHINSTTYSFRLFRSSSQYDTHPYIVNLNSHTWRSKFDEQFEAVTPFSWYPDSDSPVLNLHTPSLELPIRNTNIPIELYVVCLKLLDRNFNRNPSKHTSGISITHIATLAIKFRHRLTRHAREHRYSTSRLESFEMIQDEAEIVSSFVSSDVDTLKDCVDMFGNGMDGVAVASPKQECKRLGEEIPSIDLSSTSISNRDCADAAYVLCWSF